jgi:hypothetical protein
MAKETKQSKEELLKSIEQVLDEALREYEELSKMDDFQYAEDPSRPLAASPEAEEAQEDEAAEPAAHEAAEPAAEEAAEEEDEKKDKKEDDKEEEEEEMSDDALKSEFEALKSQMESRGLLKSEQAQEVKKEEIKTNEEVEALKKSFGESIESLSKTVAALNEKIEKIANAPMPRKGVSGLTPLRKSEEGQSLNKAEVIDKLLNLKKSGKPVETALITRFETNRATEQDMATIKALIG